MLILFSAAAWVLPLGADSVLAAVWTAASAFVLAVSRGASLGRFMSIIALIFLGPGLTLGAMLYWSSGHPTSPAGIVMYAIVVAGGVYTSVSATKAVWNPGGSRRPRT